MLCFPGFVCEDAEDRVILEPAGGGVPHLRLHTMQLPSLPSADHGVDLSSPGFPPREISRSSVFPFHAHWVVRGWAHGRRSRAVNPHRFGLDLGRPNDPTLYRLCCFPGPLFFFLICCFSFFFSFVGCLCRYFTQLTRLLIVVFLSLTFQRVSIFCFSVA